MQEQELPAQTVSVVERSCREVASIASAKSKDQILPEKEFQERVPEDDSIQVDLNLLHDRIRSKNSMRWVFAGDSNSCSSFNGRESFLRTIEDHTKSVLHRDSDIFVNATYAGARVERVRRRIQLRFDKFRPDVVIVICGFAECQSDVENCADFEMSFIELLKDIEQVGAIPVVCTPPHSDLLVQADGYIDRLIFIEAIRGCVAEHSGILIDFWKDWEEYRNTQELWDPQKARPTPTGVQRMYHHFIEELGIAHPASSDSLPPELVSRTIHNL